MSILSAEGLIEIRERCEAATPGLWASMIEGRDHTAGDSFIMRGEAGAWEEDLYLTGGTLADQDFIGHARQDVPRLLDEVERLRELLASGTGVVIDVPEYDPRRGLVLEWRDDWEIVVEIQHGAVLIKADRTGLVSLAGHLLTLAQQGVPSGHHVHYDDSNALEDGSCELIIERI